MNDEAIAKLAQSLHGALIGRGHPTTTRREGFVTLSNQGREEPASRPISNGCDSLAPRVKRRGAQGAMRSGGCEVALDVENVVDDGVSGEKFLC